MKYEVRLAGKTRVVELERYNGVLKISIDGGSLDADAVEVAPHTFSVLLNGESHQIRVAPRPDGTLTLHTGAAEYHAEVNDPRSWRGRRHGTLEAEGRQQVAAPMPGKIIRVLSDDVRCQSYGQLRSPCQLAVVRTMPSPARWSARRSSLW